MHKVLVVEDDADIARLIGLHLHDAGYAPDLVGDGHRGLARYRERRHDVVLLDRCLPGLDGMDVCRRLREEPGHVPILMLTALASVPDRVAGLANGADDYLGKPFAIPELVARVHALVRRSEAQRADPQGAAQALCFAELRTDVQRRRASLAGAEVKMTAREFDLLCHLARHPGQVFTRAQLLDAVWGVERDAFEHTVDSCVNRLRGKIERHEGPARFVQTVWGAGYRFADGF